MFLSRSCSFGSLLVVLPLSDDLTYMKVICFFFCFRLCIRSIYVCLIGACCRSRFPLMDNHNTWLMHRHAEHVLNSFPNNSLVFVKGDIHHNTLHYLQMCENHRPDVRLGASTLSLLPCFCFLSTCFKQVQINYSLFVAHSVCLFVCA